MVSQAQVSQYDNPPIIDSSSRTQFSIESNDSEVLCDQIYFILSSLDSVAEQPIVFILSLDGSVVRQISLQSLTEARRHWQAVFDTKLIPNGSYHIVEGVLDSRFEPEIWHDAGWRQVFNVAGGATDSIPPKIFSLPTTTQSLPEVVSPIVSSTPTTTEAITIATTTDEPAVAPAAPTATEFCLNQGVNEPTQCSVLELAKRYPECRTAGLWQLEECQNYLSHIYFAHACEPEHITNQAQCQQFWQQAVGQRLSCQQSAEECQQFEKNHLGEIVAQWTVSQKAQAVLNSLTHRLISFKTLQQGLSAQGIATDLTMIQPWGSDDKPVIRIVPAESAIMVEPDGTMVSSWPAVALIDSDADGLSDGAEIRYGTKKDQPDTDGDSYLDGDEVEHGYSPLGSGSLVTPVADIDTALNSGQTWQQPLQSGDIDRHLTISQVQPFANGKGVVISGQAETLETVALFIYGSQLPLVVTVRADEQGAWSYYLSQPLVDGRYTMYLAAMNKQAQILGKSESRSVYIKDNQPVTALQFVQEQPKVLGVDFVSVSSSTILMIIGGVIVAGGLLFFIGWMITRKAK